MVGEGPPSTSLIYRGKDVDTDLRRHDEAAPPKSRSQRELVLYQPTEILTGWQLPLLVMVGEGPPSTSLISQRKDVDTDLRRHDEAAPPKSRSQRELVLYQPTEI